MFAPERQSNISQCLVIIPCLNEAANIAGLLASLDAQAEKLNMKIIVVDGGSTDRTCDIVSEIMETHLRVLLLHNPRQIQSAAINLAVAQYGEGYRYLIRIDAHGSYPEDYCERLLEEADRTGADSVVVSMKTEGKGLFQRATATAQNSRLGNGGSSHRNEMRGHWTVHGHHALMRIEAFRQVGGYDETFTHNEDAELDYRLKEAGFNIWMTDKTYMVYYPRSSPVSLFRQYFGYGRGRARNIVKHRALPKVRQALPLLVLPGLVGTVLAILHWWAAVPAFLWMAACVGYGMWLAVSERNPAGLLAAVSAMIMHLAWSAGFWLQLLQRPKSTKVRDG